MRRTSRATRRSAAARPLPPEAWAPGFRPRRAATLLRRPGSTRARYSSTLSTSGRQPIRAVATNSPPGGIARSDGASQHVRIPNPAAPRMSASKLSPTIHARCGDTCSAANVCAKMRGSGLLHPTIAESLTTANNLAKPSSSKQGRRLPVKLDTTPRRWRRLSRSRTGRLRATTSSASACNWRAMAPASTWSGRTPTTRRACASIAARNPSVRMPGRRASASSEALKKGSKAANSSPPPTARYAAWKRGPQCTPSASSVPPKSKRTTSAGDLVAGVRGVPVRAHLHGHGHGLSPHLHHVVAAPALEPHVVPVILLIKRVRRLCGRPRHTAIGHEQPSDHAHAAIRDRRAGGVVVGDGDAVAVLRDDVHPQPRPAVEQRDRDRRDMPDRVRDGRGTVDHVAGRHVRELDHPPVVMHVPPEPHDLAGHGGAALVGAR